MGRRSRDSGAARVGGSVCQEKSGSLASTLRELFDRKNPSTSTVYKRLKSAQFCAYLTLNFERLLEDEFDGLVRPYIWPALFAEEAAPVLGRHPALFYLHGVIARVADWKAESIVLGAEQFNAAYRQNSQLCSFIVQLLMRRTCVFVGVSLDDPNFARLLEHCQSIVSSMILVGDAAVGAPAAPKHFVLVARGQGAEQFVDCDRLESAGLRVVSFEQKDPQYSGLIDLLDEVIPSIHATPVRGLSDGGLPNG
jgi:hypothetical protein